MSTYLRTLAVFACMLANSSGTLAQELVLGYSGSSTGPSATLSKHNDVAIEVALEEINGAGGVNGKKLVLRSFDTGGKPDQAVVAVQQFAQDLSALAVVGPLTTGECRAAFP
jgi:branched-chain amino acid transport system substrate-binding protein